MGFTVTFPLMHILRFDCMECSSKPLSVRVICEIAVTIHTEGEEPTTQMGGRIEGVTQLWLSRFSCGAVTCGPSFMGRGRDPTKDGL